MRKRFHKQKALLSIIDMVHFNSLVINIPRHSGGFSFYKNSGANSLLPPLLNSHSERRNAHF